MPDEIKTTGDSGTAEVVVEFDKEKITKEAVELERKRINTIRTLGAKVKADEKLIDKLISDGTELSVAVNALSAVEDAMLAAVPPQSQSPAVAVVAEERDKFVAIATQAMLCRQGMITERKQVEEVRASGYGALGLQNLARECLAKANVPNVHRMSAEDLFRAIVKFEAGANAQGSGDFGAALSNVLRKSVGLGWDSAPVTYPAWTKRGSLSDFKTARVVKLTNFSDVEVVPEGEARKLGKMSDLYEQATLFTVGKNASLTRQAFINDDLSVLTGIPAKLTGSVRRYVNRYVYNLIYGTNFAGHVMLEDDLACFHATHGNLVAPGAGGAVTQGRVNTGVQAMMTRPLPSPDGGASNAEYLSVGPSYILFGPSQRLAVYHLLNDTFYLVAGGDQASTQAGNPFKGAMTPVEETLLDFLNTGFNPWYLAANPNIVDTVTVFTLNGQDSPVVESDPSRVSEPDGMVWGIRYDFCAEIIDWRGLYCNPGA